MWREWEDGDPVRQRYVGLLLCEEAVDDFDDGEGIKKVGWRTSGFLGGGGRGGLREVAARGVPFVVCGCLSTDDGWTGAQVAREDTGGGEGSVAGGAAEGGGGEMGAAESGGGLCWHAACAALVGEMEGAGVRGGGRRRCGHDGGGDSKELGVEIVRNEGSDGC